MHLPDAAVTDPLFKPQSQGGLGVDPERFFDRSFNFSTLDHYPYRDTTPRWCGVGPVCA